MYYLLLPSVPLAKFHMFSGYVWDQSRSRNFRNTIGLIITQYTNTLGILQAVLTKQFSRFNIKSKIFVSAAGLYKVHKL